MVSKSYRNDRRILKREMNIEEFKETILNDLVLFPTHDRRSIEPNRLEYIFFIILSAMLARANSINQIAIFAKSKAQWISD